MKEDVKFLNEKKSATRISLNGAMIGVIFFILTLIWTAAPGKFNAFIIWQLLLAIPMLFVSSLSYGKIGYRENSLLFDRFGWVTSTLGNNLVLNTAALLGANFYKSLGYLYVVVLLVGITIYYMINILSSDQPLRQTVKLLFIYIIVLVGAFLPLSLYY